MKRPNPSDPSYAIWQEIAEVVVRNPEVEDRDKLLSICVFPSSHETPPEKISGWLQEQLQRRAEWKEEEARQASADQSENAAGEGASGTSLPLPKASMPIGGRGPQSRTPTP